MKQIIAYENDIRHADWRHPVDILEPLPSGDDGTQRVCEVLRRTFGWVAEADNVEQKGLRASIVLHCVHSDFVGAATLEELGATVGFPLTTVENLIADFRHTVGWE